jgi:hypothetical protein
LPVQIGLGPRTWAGRLSSGHVRVGDEVAVLPGGARAAVAGLTVAGRPVAEARAPLSIAVELDRDVDVQRGDMLVRVRNRPDLRRAVGDAAEVMAIQTRRPGPADPSWPSFRHDNRGTAWLVPGTPASTTDDDDVSDAIDAPVDNISSD